MPLIRFLSYSFKAWGPELNRESVLYLSSLKVGQSLILLYNRHKSFFFGLGRLNFLKAVVKSEDYNDSIASKIVVFETFRQLHKIIPKNNIGVRFLSPLQNRSCKLDNLFFFFSELFQKVDLTLFDMTHHFEDIDVFIFFIFFDKLN